MHRAVLMVSAAAFLVVCGEADSTRISRFIVATQLVGAKQVEAKASTKPAAADDADDPDGSCPAGMVLAEGDYCRIARHRCKRYLDKSGPFRTARCAEYEQPARCVLELRRKFRFCIDRDEYVAPGTTVPLTGKTMVQAEQICRDSGKRLCRESEWNFACEGEEIRPYPYGWNRDSSACNADRKSIVGADDRMVSMVSPPGSYPRCESPFGVRDMTGNVEEWAVRDDYPSRGAMKGSYWIPTRNHCRAAQRIHGPQYSGIELGFRCCADAPAR